MCRREDVLDLFHKTSPKVQHSINSRSISYAPQWAANHQRRTLLLVTQRAILVYYCLLQKAFPEASAEQQIRTELATYKSIVHDLQQHNEALQAALSHAHLQTNVADASVSSLQSELKAFKAKNEEMRAAIAALEATVAKERSEREAAQEQSQVYSHGETALQASVDTLKQENAMLQQQISQLQSSDDKITAVAKERTWLQEELARVQHALACAQTQLHDALSNSSKMQSEQQRDQAEIERLLAKIDEVSIVPQSLCVISDVLVVADRNKAQAALHGLPREEPQGCPAGGGHEGGRQ